MRTNESFHFICLQSWWRRQPRRLKNPARTPALIRAHLFTQPVKNPVTEVVEPIKGSDIPLHLITSRRLTACMPRSGCESSCKWPLSIILFAHMNGGLGTQWIREWTENGSWTLEQFLKAGYAVAWTRYRAEVAEGYGIRLVEGKQEGRQIFKPRPRSNMKMPSPSPIRETLPYIDPEPCGIPCLSHGARWLMKIAQSTTAEGRHPHRSRPRLTIWRGGSSRAILMPPLHRRR